MSVLRPPTNAGDVSAILTNDLIAADHLDAESRLRAVLCVQSYVACHRAALPAVTRWSVPCFAVVQSGGRALARLASCYDVKRRSHRAMPTWLTLVQPRFCKPNDPSRREICN